jgi:hypothetical protein
VNRITLTIKYLLAAILIVSSTAVAQTTQNTGQSDPAWEKVKALPYDELISVRLKSGSTLDGTLINVSDTNLKLYRTSENSSGIAYDDIVDLKKEDLRNVYRLEKKSSTKWLFIGAAAGAAAGMAIGSISVGDCASRPSAFGDICGRSKTGFMVLGGLGGAAIGGSLGHLVGRKRFKRVLIYESK